MERSKLLLSRPHFYTFCGLGLLLLFCLSSMLARYTDEKYSTTFLELLELGSLDEYIDDNLL